MGRSAAGRPRARAARLRRSLGLAARASGSLGLLFSLFSCFLMFIGFISHNPYAGKQTDRQITRETYTDRQASEETDRHQ